LRCAVESSSRQLLARATVSRNLRSRGDAARDPPRVLTAGCLEDLVLVAPVFSRRDEPSAAGADERGALDAEDEPPPDEPPPFDPDEPASDRTVHRGRINRQILGHQDEIWNAYSQSSVGPLFLRIGRQNLSWGETDGFRLLDMINPLDNRFGLPLVEDLDDRRIPLWMARGTLALPWQTANLTNLTLDSYFAPAQIAHQESPVAPRGSPFAIPAPPTFLLREVTRPGRAPDDSRGLSRVAV